MTRRVAEELAALDEAAGDEARRRARGRERGAMNAETAMVSSQRDG